MAYLKHFPLTCSKSTKLLSTTFPIIKDDMEIAATIIAMGHTLGFKVLAEGVETAEQLSFLSEQGCDLYQGYLKSKPLYVDSFAKFLHRGNSSHD